MSGAAGCVARPAAVLPFAGYASSVPEVLEAVGAPEVLARQTRILIKPNLVNASPPPVTLPVACVESLVAALRGWTDAELLVGEAPGEMGLSAADAFRCHGYDRLERDQGVGLVDLDAVELVRLEDPGCRVFREFWLPRVVLESFVISVAVLKAHSLAGVALSMKNMMGCAPAAHYREGGTWNKGAFHRHMDHSVYELNRYRKPDLALLDASVGLAEFHLGGPECDPPVGKLVAGFDPVAVDAVGAELLGVPWQEVGHLALADGVLGDARGGAG